MIFYNRHRNLILCSLALIALQMGCKDKNISSVKEEGLFLASNQSLMKVVGRMANEYKWDSATQAAALKTLKEVAPATFNIICDASAGSGVFIGPNGQFVSVAHVIDKSHYCHIQTLKLAEDDFIVGEDSYVLVAVDKSKRSISRFDLSQGSIVGFNSPHYIKPAPNGSPFKNQLILNLGFPSETNRNGKEIFYKKQSLEAHIYNDELFDTYCGDVANRERIQKMASLGSFDPEWTELYKTEIEACAVAKSERATQRMVSYDLIPRSETSYPLALGFGKLAWFDKNNGIVTNDSFHGMSGGPLVDLKTGSLVGLNDRGISRTMDASVSISFSELTDLTSIFYGGAKIIQLISTDRLADIPWEKIPAAKKVTSDQFKNCLNSIGQRQSEVGLTRIEERDGNVRVALFAHGKTYDVQMKSAVPKQTKFYHVNMASGLKTQLQVSYDTDTAGSAVVEASEKSALGVTLAEITAKEMELSVAQSEALKSDVAEYWMAMKHYVENQLQTKIANLDEKSRIAAAVKMANDLRAASVPQGLSACAPVMNESENLQLRTFFGLGL